MKYSHLIGVIFCGLLIVTGCNQTSLHPVINGKVSWSDSAVSFVKIYTDASGKKAIQRDNTYYDITSFINHTATTDYLLKMTKMETAYIDSPPIESAFALTATDIATGKSWSKKLMGNDIDYTNKVIILHHEPKDNEHEDTYTMYSLLTGDKLMSYTYGETRALIPNTSHKRFFGYLSQMSCVDDKPADLGIVSYCGSEHIIDRIAVKVRAGQTVPAFTPELKMMAVQGTSNTVANEGKTVILASVNRNFTSKDIHDFAFEVNYYLPNRQEPVHILLPIREDKIDLTNADYDNKIFELTRLAQ
jgi:hypothetical protein